MKHEKVDLPYELWALAPHISEETMTLHYTKHHQTYIDKLNTLIEWTEYANMELRDIVMKSQWPIFNNAAQAENHNMFWQIMIPGWNNDLSDELSSAIDESFWDFESFKKWFEETAVNTFGSGWAWLVKNQDGSLEITSTSNADTPTRLGKNPILCLDVWEHAYYVDYRNARPKYVEAFWNIVNWNKVSSLYAES